MLLTRLKIVENSTISFILVRPLFFRSKVIGGVKLDLGCAKHGSMREGLLSGFCSDYSGLKLLGQESTVNP